MTDQNLDTARLRSWWDAIAQEVPDSVQGLWFGLVTLVREERESNELYVAGSSTFDAEDEPVIGRAIRRGRRTTVGICSCRRSRNSAGLCSRNSPGGGVSWVLFYLVVRGGVEGGRPGRLLGR